MRLDNIGRVERLLKEIREARRTAVGLPGAVELVMLRLEETVLAEYRDECPSSELVCSRNQGLTDRSNPSGLLERGRRSNRTGRLARWSPASVLLMRGDVEKIARNHSMEALASTGDGLGRAAKALLAKLDQASGSVTKA